MAGSTQAKIPSQLGRTAVVTGATGGLGYETALALARAGSEVILTGRDDRKGRSAIEKISGEVTGAKVSYEHLDLASLASVADFAQRMGARQSLDLLINNAGVMALPRRQTTADGFEMQFGTNHLGHFALTAGLMPLLRRATGPRVVSVSSLAHRTGFIDFNDLQGARVYSPWKAYGQSKLATLMFALELQRRSDAAGWNLTSNAAHPGFARTNLFASGPGGLLSLATDFAAPFFASFGGGRRPADPVRGDEPGGKAGCVLRTGRIWRTARRTGTRADHAAGARHGNGRQTLGCFREIGGCHRSNRRSADANWRKTSSMSDFRRTIWSRCCGSGSRMSLFALIMLLPVRRGQKQYRHDALGLRHQAQPSRGALAGGGTERLPRTDYRERGPAETATDGRSRWQSCSAGASGI